MANTLLVLSILSFIFGVNAQYDYFQMIQQWPPAKCSGIRTKCRASPPTMFTIVGLLPSNYSDLNHSCKRLPFIPAKIARLRPQLNTYWPDVINGNNTRLWQYNWDSHGTCSDPPFNQTQYFQTTLNIRTNHNYDLLSILHAAGLGPTGTVVCQYHAIEGVIQAATGKTPGLHCNTNARTKNVQLFEIILCFDKDGVTLIDCTSSVGITCPSQFVWVNREPLSLAAAFGELKDSLVYESSMGKFLTFFILLMSVFFIMKRFY